MVYVISRLLAPKDESCTLDKFFLKLRGAGYRFLLSEGLEQVQSIVALSNKPSGDLVSHKEFPRTVAVLQQEANEIRLVVISVERRDAENLISDFLSVSSDLLTFPAPIPPIILEHHEAEDYADRYISGLFGAPKHYPTDKALGKIDLVSVDDLIKKGESARLEFKSALNWDYKLGKQSRDIENATGKMLCAFMNSEGGTLVIGVDDKGQIIGVEKDFSLLSKPDRDGFEQKLTGLANSCLGKENATYVHLSWQDVEGKTVAVVSVDKSKRPVYLDLQGKSEFYVRIGNTSQPLDVREATTYIRDHWPSQLQ
jgi:hypothetical protein